MAGNPTVGHLMTTRDPRADPRKGDSLVYWFGGRIRWERMVLFNDGVGVAYITQSGHKGWMTLPRWRKTMQNAEVLNAGAD